MVKIRFGVKEIKIFDDEINLNLVTVTYAIEFELNTKIRS